MKKTVLLLTLLALLGGCSRKEETVPTAAPTAVPETAVPATPAPTAPAESAAPAESTPPAEAVGPIESGSYTYDSPDYGLWQLNIKANGTFSLLHDGHIYNGEGWADNGDGTVTTGGAAEAAGAAPFFDEFGSSVWRIRGESCQPVG